MHDGRIDAVTCLPLRWHAGYIIAAACARACLRARMHTCDNLIQLANNMQCAFAATKSWYPQCSEQLTLTDCRRIPSTSRGCGIAECNTTWAGRQGFSMRAISHVLLNRTGFY